MESMIVFETIGPGSSPGGSTKGGMVEWFITPILKIGNLERDSTVRIRFPPQILEVPS